MDIKPPAGSSEPPFARFPVELICGIMGIAAKESRSSALALALVSKQVHDWITPTLYQTVVPDSGQAADRFYRGLVEAIRSNQGQREFIRGSPHVRNLFLPSQSHRNDAGLKILRMCHQVERLALHLFTSSRAWKELGWPAPWEVSVTSYASGDWLTHPVLRNVTHLYLREAVLSSGDNLSSACLSLRRLTHLGLGYLATDEFLVLVKGILAAKSSIQLMLVVGGAKPMFVGRVWVQLAEIEDERLLSRGELSLRDFRDFLRSGKTMWDDARLAYGNWRSSVGLFSHLPSNTSVK